MHPSHSPLTPPTPSYGPAVNSMKVASPYTWDTFSEQHRSETCCLAAFKSIQRQCYNSFHVLTYNLYILCSQKRWTGMVINIIWEVLVCLERTQRSATSGSLRFTWIMALSHSIWAHNSGAVAPQSSAFDITDIPMPVAYFPSGQWLPQAAKHHSSSALTVLQTQKTQQPQGPFSWEPRLAGFRPLLLTEKNLWSQVATVFY